MGEGNDHLTITGSLHPRMNVHSIGKSTYFVGKFLHFTKMYAYFIGKFIHFVKKSIYLIGKFVHFVGKSVYSLGKV